MKLRIAGIVALLLVASCGGDDNPTGSGQVSLVGSYELTSLTTTFLTPSGQSNITSGPPDVTGSLTFGATSYTMIVNFQDGGGDIVVSGVYSLVETQISYRTDNGIMDSGTARNSGQNVTYVINGLEADFLYSFRRLN